jgi:hypothetical protein
LQAISPGSSGRSDTGNQQISASDPAVSFGGAAHIIVFRPESLMKSVARSNSTEIV